MSSMGICLASFQELIEGVVAAFRAVKVHDVLRIAAAGLTPVVDPLLNLTEIFQIYCGLRFIILFHEALHGSWRWRFHHSPIETAMCTGNYSGK